MLAGESGSLPSLPVKFHYAVGHYWEGNSGHAGFYTYMGEIGYGRGEDAENFLAYVKRQSPEKDWKIFKVEEYVS